MRIGLRWKIAGAYAVLMLALAAGLILYIEHAVSERIILELRGGLEAECRLVRGTLEGRPQPYEPASVRELEAGIRARITVIAPDGKVLADSEAQVGKMEPHNTRPEVVDARTYGLGWSIRHSATLGTDMLYVAEAESPYKPVVRLAMPLSAVRQASANVRHAILLAALVGALLAILAGAWLSGGITRSLVDLTAAAKRIGGGDLGTRARADTADETRDLADALNAMAASLSGARSNLEQSGAHLRSVLAQMADGVIVVAPDERVQVFNPAAGALLRADPATALGRPLSEVALHYELSDLARRALRLRTLARGVLVTTEDSPRTIAAVATPVHGDAGQLVGAVMSLRDMTELQRLQQVRQDFVTNASHELRTPVAAIRSLAETLAGGASSDPDAGPRFLNQIVENTENLARLLDDMMSLAKLEGAGDRAKPMALSVRDLLTEAAARLGPQAEDKSITVSVEADGDLEVWCSEDNLMAALVNLVDNAVKYTCPGGHVVIAGERANDHAKLTVTDDGPGIPERDRERIFERFYRVDKGRSRSLGGTGLGLSIVKHAIESDGGQVWVEAPPEGGTRFVIILPCAPDSP